MCIHLYVFLLAYDYCKGTWLINLCKLVFNAVNCKECLCCAINNFEKYKFVVLFSN